MIKRLIFAFILLTGSLSATPRNKCICQPKPLHECAGINPATGKYWTQPCKTSGDKAADHCSRESCKCVCRFKTKSPVDCNPKNGRHCHCAVKGSENHR